MNKRRLVFIYVVISSILFFSRFVVFAHTQNVGIEHDSGWYMGVARNLAEKGIYASYTNTIADANAPGPHPSIHGRFSVQDTEGYSYFPAGVTVGPGFIVPQAVVYKLFGVGEWQNRVVSLASLAALILLLNWITFALGGFFGLILFQMWTWFFPQLFLNWSMEAFSEHLALLYLLLGYLIFVRATNHFKLALSGILIGLAVLTKNVYLIGIISPLICLFLQRHRIQLRQLITRSLAFIVGFFLFIFVFEIYRFFELFLKFGIDSYLAINKDIYLTMKCCGSGVQQFIENPLPLQFMIKKIQIWNDVGIHPLLLLAIVPIVLWRSKHRKNNPLFCLVFSFFILYFGWFVVLSSTGFFRHAWPSIIVGFIILSTIPSLTNRTHLLVLLSVVFSIYLSISPNSIAAPYFTQKEVETVRSKSNGSAGPLFISFFRLDDQRELQNYIQTKLKKISRICYDEILLVAEMPIYVDRVFYPEKRCAPGDMLIIGPYQKQLLIRNRQYLPQLIKTRCDKTLFENTSYTLCSMK